MDFHAVKIKEEKYLQKSLTVAITLAIYVLSQCEYDNYPLNPH